MSTFLPNVSFVIVITHCIAENCIKDAQTLKFIVKYAFVIDFILMSAYCVVYLFILSKFHIHTDCYVILSRKLVIYELFDKIILA